MKIIKLFFIGWYLFSFSIQAQQTCGIYSTVTDYRSKQISIPANYQFGKKAIQVSDFFLRPYVYIKTEHGKVKYHEDSLYAIKDNKGNIFRIWNRKAYLLTDTGKLQIYSNTYMGTVKIRTSRGFRFEQKQMTDYYFSVDDTSEIVPLTLMNVRLALLTNKKLDALLRKSFPNDATLQSHKNNQFEINQFILNNINSYEK